MYYNAQYTKSQRKHCTITAVAINPMRFTFDPAKNDKNTAQRRLVLAGKRGTSPEIAVRLSKVFGGTEQGWLVQQAQYDLAQVRRDRIKLKRLELVSYSLENGKLAISRKPPLRRRFSERGPQLRRGLIRRGSFHVIDDKHVHRPFGRFHLETQLFL